MPRGVVQRARRKLRRVLGRPAGPAILMYHRIAKAEYDPWRLAVSPDAFAGQVGWLKRNRTLLPLAEFAERHAQGRLPKAAVALTFDDGYACNAEVAAPILRSLDAPATIFLTTAMLSAPAGFWWDRLEQIVGCAPAGLFAAHVGEARLSFVLEPGEGVVAGSAREEAYRALWTALQRWPEDPRDSLLQELARRVGAPPQARPSHRVMTEAQARALTLQPQITLGAHTMRHPALSGLPPEARRAEIEGSRRACAELTGAPPTVFAYPYGDYDAATVEAVRSAGFQAAVTTDQALVAPGCDSLRLPRVQVGDWSAARLAEALAG